MFFLAKASTLNTTKQLSPEKIRQIGFLDRIFSPTRGSGSLYAVFYEAKVFRMIKIATKIFEANLQVNKNWPISIRRWQGVIGGIELL